MRVDTYASRGWRRHTAALLFALVAHQAQGLPLDSGHTVLRQSGGKAESSFKAFAKAEAPTQLRQAVADLNAGKFDLAITRAKQYLAEHPRSAPAQEIIGTGLVLKGNVDEGLNALKAAVALDPQQASAHTKIGDVLLLKGDRVAAQPYFLKAVELDPADRFAQQRLGLLYEAAGHDTKAIAHLEKGLIGTDPFYVGVKINLARLYNAHRQYDKAIVLLEPLLKQKITLPPDVRLMLGGAYLNKERLNEAAQQFQAVLKADQKNGAALLALGTAQRLQGNLEAAIKTLQAGTSALPKDAAPWVQLGETYVGLQRWQLAIEAFQRAEALSPQPQNVRKQLAQAYIGMGRLDQAIGIYEQLLAAGSVAPDVLGGLGTAYQLAGRLADAEKIYQRLATQYPKEPAAYLALGEQYGFKKDYAAAIKAFEKGLSLAPADPTLLNALTVAQSRGGNTRGAATTAKRLVDSAPAQAGHHFLLGSMLEQAQDLPGAMNAYRQALRLNPKHALAANNLAMVLIDSGLNVEHALQAAEQAHRLAPENPLISDTYGWALIQNGKARQALPILEKAAQKAGPHPSILYHLGMAQFRTGNHQGARGQFTKVLELAPASKEAKLARDALGRM